MAKNEDKAVTKRIIQAYISSIVSTALVLFLVAVAGTLYLNTYRISNYFKENVKIAVLMKSGVNEKKALDFERELSALPYVKDTKFVSAEEGIEETRRAYGDIFINEFAIPPIPDAIEIVLYPQYINSDSLKTVSSRIMQSDIVDEVSYKESIVDLLNANTEKITLFILVFVVALLFISLVLISNSVRLTIHANRFNIHTMKLVGATKGFIRRPYVIQAVFQGLISSILAMLVFIAILLCLKQDMQGFFEFFSREMFLQILALVVGTGVIICTVSTRVVVNKLIKYKKEELM